METRSSRWVDHRRYPGAPTDSLAEGRSPRAPWRDDYGPDWTSFPIARLRYTATTNTWILYWRDRHLKFHRYDMIDPTPQIEDLLTEIDRDPSGIFWG
jgi:hypothetical protein